MPTLRGRIRRRSAVGGCTGTDEGVLDDLDRLFSSEPEEDILAAEHAAKKATEKKNADVEDQDESSEEDELSEEEEGTGSKDSDSGCGAQSLARACARAANGVPFFTLLEKKDLPYPAVRTDAKSEGDNVKQSSAARESKAVPLPISTVPGGDEAGADHVNISSSVFLRALDEIATEKISMDFGRRGGGVFFSRGEWFTRQSDGRTIDFGQTTTSGTDTPEEEESCDDVVIATILVVFPTIAENISIDISSEFKPDAAPRTVTLSKNSLHTRTTAMWVYGSGTFVLQCDGPALVGLFDVYDGQESVGLSAEVLSFGCGLEATLREQLGRNTNECRGEQITGWYLKELYENAEALTARSAHEKDRRLVEHLRSIPSCVVAMANVVQTITCKQEGWYDEDEVACHYRHGDDYPHERPTVNWGKEKKIEEDDSARYQVDTSSLSVLAPLAGSRTVVDLFQQKLRRVPVPDLVCNFASGTAASATWTKCKKTRSEFKELDVGDLYEGAGEDISREVYSTRKKTILLIGFCSLNTLLDLEITASALNLYDRSHLEDILAAGKADPIHVQRELPKQFWRYVERGGHSDLVLQGLICALESEDGQEAVGRYARAHGPASVVQAASSQAGYFNVDTISTLLSLLGEFELDWTGSEAQNLLAMLLKMMCARWMNEVSDVANLFLLAESLEIAVPDAAYSRFLDECIADEDDEWRGYPGEIGKVVAAGALTGFNFEERHATKLLDDGLRSADEPEFQDAITMLAEMAYFAEKRQQSAPSASTGFCTKLVSRVGALLNSADFSATRVEQFLQQLVKQDTACRIAAIEEDEEAEDSTSGSADTGTHSTFLAEIRATVLPKLSKQLASNCNDQSVNTEAIRANVNRLEQQCGFDYDSELFAILKDKQISRAIAQRLQVPKTVREFADEMNLVRELYRSENQVADFCLANDVAGILLSLVDESSDLPRYCEVLAAAVACVFPGASNESQRIALETRIHGRLVMTHGGTLPLAKGNFCRVAEEAQAVWRAVGGALALSGNLADYVSSVVDLAIMEEATAAACTTLEVCGEFLKEVGDSFSLLPNDAAKAVHESLTKFETHLRLPRTRGKKPEDGLLQAAVKLRPLGLDEVSETTLTSFLFGDSTSCSKVSVPHSAREAANAVEGATLEGIGVQVSGVFTVSVDQHRLCFGGILRGRATGHPLHRGRGGSLSISKTDAGKKTASLRQAQEVALQQWMDLGKMMSAVSSLRADLEEDLNAGGIAPDDPAKRRKIDSECVKKAGTKSTNSAGKTS
mmetsp:Transcript_18949/g.47325  ORF Transcript_18949/g.47325 Transcript_18949/m.47325 type:complete len:1277 (+) Transcript_18949:134-3964(+)|eukprot:CAMPEP_0178998242 /NCGR_PEP_ID=MMETSP0795-20121207/9413_1 /TAXON_ID=88552 /ORGANISM="Amoebophrya sp., Strain Ameob2" /LENGTH=1276 /DNA_ID=CAMNT_0020690917 /DNA_START=47 /DNA_END=3877 /DNA_ORIENTATION=+